MFALKDDGGSAAHRKTKWRRSMTMLSTFGTVAAAAIPSANAASPTRPSFIDVYTDGYDYDLVAI